MLRFNDIADRLLEFHPGADLELLQRAYVYSAKVHEGQERLSGEPYLVHPLEVAGLLVEMRVDDVTVAAGLLHDTLEDTLTTVEEIERLFGERVAFLVEGLTKIARIEFTSVRERQAENFRKMLLAMSKDLRILLIKLADRLHNMRTLKYVAEDQRRRVAQETVDIYVPLAHRLGIYWMKQELEDLAFRALKPHVAEDLERQLTGSREEREHYIEEVISILSSKLAQAGLQAEVTGRLKDLASIHSKMESQGLSLDQIYDMIAFRIILDGPPEGTYTALGVVHGTWRPVPSRFKDYVALPKANGYQSLHTTAIGPYGERMEVQIRTAAMHDDAEFGIAAHWKYKEGRIGADGHDERQFAWLRRLLEWGELADPHEFLDAVKVDLFPDEVFVFTPRGEVINLPSGASTVDFAYAIHSEVGAHCSGAKVNGKLVPLRHRLVDGDTVEITTSASQHPRKDWLDFVVSSKARNRIRHDIRFTERARARELGRDILARELKRAGFSLQKLEQGEELSELARKEGRGASVDDLFRAVSYGKVSASELVKTLRGEEASEEPELSRTGRLRSLFRRPKSDSLSPGIRVSGLPDVLVRFGGCCDPVPGDEVTGFVTRGRGVTVHANDCPRALDLDPQRKVDVSWDEQTVARRVRIRVASRNQPGILAQIINSISTSGTNIGDVTVTTKEGELAVHHFELWVNDLGTLRSLMTAIERVRGVSSVERVRG